MLLYNDSAVTLVRVRIRAELSGFALLPLKADCLACHQPHTWTAEADSCAVCHTDKEEHYTGMDCVDCHWEAGAEE